MYEAAVKFVSRGLEVQREEATVVRVWVVGVVVEAVVVV